MGNPNILAERVELGVGVTFGDGVTIQAVSGPAQLVRIGDYTYIGDDVSIRCPWFSVGDYGKIHRQSLFAGYDAMSIGHNVWFGQGSVFDSTGRLTIGDNCCVGAHSSLWSHMKFGDTLFGCRFNHKRPLIIGKDVWIGDSTVVTPCQVWDQVIVLANSTVTHDLAPNRVYAGNPAADVTTKLGGPPYEPLPVIDRLSRLRELRHEFAQAYDVDVSDLFPVATEADFGIDPDVTYFAVDARTYTKRGTKLEAAFLMWLLPEKAKFTPYGG